MHAPYFAKSNNVCINLGNNEFRVAAVCDDAPKAAKLLNDAKDLNDNKRRYTAAARKIAQAEALPGFRWVEG